MVGLSSQASARAFDALAPTYDRDFTHRPVGRALRRIVWERYDASFPRGARVLDLGCGTGADAFHLSAGGRSVTAIDSSAGMLEEARAVGAARERVRPLEAGAVEFRRLQIERLDALGGEMFDGVVSGFGALNCVADIEALGRSLAAIVRPGGRVVAVVMGRWCPWEMAWHAAAGAPRKALRRLGGSTTARLGGEAFTVQYFTPHGLARRLGASFRTVGFRGLGVALPPSAAAAAVEARPALLRLCTVLENMARARWLAYAADHFILEVERRPGR
jgi:ubiquinone/menaquinone biosynthesis C-methylase UbiE